MHASALAYIAANMPRTADRVLEFGSRNVNGSARTVCCVSRYVGVDIEPGPGVDIVADAALVVVGELFDVVVCAEVLEHADDDTCIGIVDNAFAHLKPGGVLVATMAGLGREPHSAVDGGPVRAGEFYRNVDYYLLESWLSKAGFERWHIDTRGDDIRCVASKA